MARLNAVKGSFASIAPQLGPAIVRDVLKNDIAPRRVAFVAESSDEQHDGVDIITIDSITSQSRLGGYTLASAHVAGAEVIEITLERSGLGYRLNLPGGTPEALASLAYGDPARVNFSSVPDFVRLAMQNQAIEAAIVALMGTSTKVVGLILDQVDYKLLAVGDAAPAAKLLTSTNFYVSVTFDDQQATQFGE